MLPKLSKFIERVRKASFAGGIAAAVVLMSFHVWSAYDTYTGLTARAATAQAVITDITQGRNRRMVGLYSFVTQEGVAAAGHFSMPADAASNARARQSISIVYDHANPSRNALSLESAWLSLRNGAIVWLLMCPALLMLGYYCSALRRRDGRAPAPSPC